MPSMRGGAVRVLLAEVAGAHGERLGRLVATEATAGADEVDEAVVAL